MKHHKFMCSTTHSKTHCMVTCVLEGHIVHYWKVLDNQMLCPENGAIQFFAFHLMSLLGPL